MVSALDRRSYSRIELTEGQLDAEVNTGIASPARAAVTNLSRGGVLLGFQSDPEDGTGVGNCIVRFRNTNTSERVRPTIARGLIRRRTTVGRATFLAIEFVEPLESLGPLSDDADAGSATEH